MNEAIEDIVVVVVVGVKKNCVNSNGCQGQLTYLHTVQYENL